MKTQNERPNDKLRAFREIRGWSQRYVAERIGTSDTEVSRWEAGRRKPSRYYQTKLCELFAASAFDLGFLDAPPVSLSPLQQPNQTLQLLDVTDTSLVVEIPLEALKAKATPFSSSKQTQQLVFEKDITQRGDQFCRGQAMLERPHIEASLEALNTLANEGIDMNRSRRALLQLVGNIGAGTLGAAYFAINGSPPSPSLQSLVQESNAVVDSLAILTQHFRTLQRAGFAIEPGLRDQIALIQSILEKTISERQRRELWHILAQTQLLARHSITTKAELGRARTWNEAAIASAQYSGDTLLFGAALGHLGHLYLTWLDDARSARQLLEEAQGYVKGHSVAGWLAIVSASVAAKEGSQKECEVAINQALEAAYGLPQTTEQADLYYTDFNIIGTRAFAGNCLLKIGLPGKALECLLAVDLKALSKNRLASAYHDIACAYAAMGDLEAVQTYAFQSIDCALTTNRTYIIPRFMNLARRLQQHDPHEPHTTSILEYAQHALSKGGISE